MNGRNRSKARPRTVTQTGGTFGQYTRHAKHDRQRRYRQWVPMSMLCAAHGRYISRGVVAGCW